jgi:hypothetical protein
VDQKQAQSAVVAKLEWARPELQRIEAGSAEAGNNANEDGGDAIVGPRS